MNKNLLTKTIMLLGIFPFACSANVQIGQTWQKIKDEARDIKQSAKQNVEIMKTAKKSTEMVGPSLAFIGDLKQQIPSLMKLMESLSITLKNLQTVGGKKYDDPKMRKETMLAVFENTISKADEIFDKLFAVLYNLDGIILKAGELNFVDIAMSDQFKQVLLACRSVALVTMKFFKDRLGPDLIDFLYRLETISPAAKK